MSTINSDLLVLHLIKHLIRKSDEMNGQSGVPNVTLPPQTSEEFLPQLRQHLLQQIHSLERTLNTFRSGLEGSSDQAITNKVATELPQKSPSQMVEQQLSANNAHHQTKTPPASVDSLNIFKDIAFLEEEHVGEFLPGGFVVSNAKSGERNYYWANERNKKAYVAILNIPGDSPKLDTTPLIGSFLLNEVVGHTDRANASDIVRDFERRFVSLSARHTGSLAEELRIAVIVLDKVKAKMEFSGLGIDFYQVSGKKVNKFVGREHAIKSGAKGNLENHEIGLGRSQSYYLFANDSQNNLSKVFEENIKKLSSRDAEERKLNLTQKVQDNNEASQTQDFVMLGFGL